MSRDNVDSVTTPGELLKSHLNEQTKTHVVRDDQGRVRFAFTASVDVKDGGPCMCTEYIYDGLNSNAYGFQERVYRWKAIWDANFTFDPTADYDADGDGVL